MQHQDKEQIVHGLWNGYPLCGFTNLAQASWPAGHTWVWPDREPDKITCPDCKAEMEELQLPLKNPNSQGRTVHALWQGLVLCGFAQTPDQWPDGHVWVDARDIDSITCSKCKEEAEKLKAKPKPIG